MATDTRGVRGGVLSVSPSIVVAPSADSWLTAGATASRYADAASSVGGSIGAGGRAPLGGSPVGFTLAAGASFTRASYGARFALAEAVPALETRRGAAVLSIGARVAAASSSLPIAAPAGLPGAPVARAGSADITRGVISAILVGGARGLPAHGRLVDILYREERGRVSDVGVADRAVALAVSSGTQAVAASVGMRSARDERVPFGSASLSFGLRTPVAFELAAGRYASNRLTGVPGGTFASAGIVLRRAIAAPREKALPQPRGAAAATKGFTRLSILAPRAARVEVAGDWNSWRALPAQRALNGVWYVDLELPPGRYRYAFRVDGSTWTVPEGAPAEDDGLGGKTAWLTVRPA